MKPGTCICLLIAGAVLVYAVTVNTPVLDLHVTGFILMVAGALGLTLPRASPTVIRWVRRRTLWSEPRRPRYIKINPDAHGYENTLQPGELSMARDAEEFLDDKEEP